MNFLLHRHLAIRDLGSLEAAAGSMLPDLWRMADRRARARSGIAVPASGKVLEVLRGIEHHLVADHAFHEGPFFHRGNDRAVELCLAAVPKGRKIRLLAHPAWELCLDGALLRRQGVETELAALRETAPLLVGEAALEAAELHCFAAARRAPPDRDKFLRRMRQLAADLAQGDWIAGYVHGRGVAARLNGLRRRLGLDPVSGTDLSRLEEALDRLIELADQELPGLLSDLPTGLESGKSG